MNRSIVVNSLFLLFATVIGANSFGNVALSPSPLPITVSAGSKSAQTVRVIASGVSLNETSANIQSNKSWCTVSGFDGRSFKITIDPSSLGIGAANAIVTFAPNGSGANFLPVTLPVVATVLAPQN